MNTVWKGQRVICHVDFNSYYASVECLYNPSIRYKPVVVGGKEENRHGIVLAANALAKKYGIKTGNALWEARNACKDLVVVHPHYDKYLTISKLAREILYDYSDLVESFGLDENWCDITGSIKRKNSPEEIAEEIRRRMKDELGLTVSIGLSFNKIFAKLGSDMKKPDAITIITKDNYKYKVWALPAEDLLYVGRKTKPKLNIMGIRTIGDLACADPDLLKVQLGKIGVMLWGFANGIDTTPVMNIDENSVIKSIGNSTTTPRDLLTEADIKITLYLLCESVAARLREYNFICSTVQVSIRDKSLFSFERQRKLPFPCADSDELFKIAYDLVLKNKPAEPIRSLGVRACQLSQGQYRQLSIHPTEEKIFKHELVENTLDEIRNRFGAKSIVRGLMHTDQKLAAVNPKDDHTIHPVSFLK